MSAKPLLARPHTCLSPVAAWLTLALSAVACSAGPDAQPPSAAVPAATRTSPPLPPTIAPSPPASATLPAPPPPPAPSVTWQPPSPIPVSPEGNVLPSLPALYGSLLSLRTRARADHVRVMWLGDSHTQPDIWTAAVREPLQERFGNGGPGFLHVGFDKWGYRHRGVKFDVQGTWLLEPKRLLSEKRWGDGVLGLCGIRLTPDGSGASAVVVDATALPGAATWDLAFRPVDSSAALEVQVGDSPPRAIAMQGADGAGAIRHEVWATPGPGGKLAVLGGSHGVQLDGVVVEATGSSGVVFDVLGLNGARVVHALAWDEQAWEAEVARRRPDLVILAYGTNESGIKGLGMRRFTQQLEALVDRARKAAPASECLIIGAMDRGGAKMSARIGELNAAQEQAAKDRGCAFWSAQRAMGGRGSMERWAKEIPPAGASDHVHLNSIGYRRLGATLARDLLGMLDAGTASSTPP